MSTSDNAVLRGDTERIAIHRAILHGCVVGDEGQIGMGEIPLDGVRVGRGPRARWAAMPRWVAGSTVRSS